MRLSEQEKAAQRAAFRNMSRMEKAEHVFTYYKWPILLGLIALIVLGSVVQRLMTKKEPLMYLAFANVAVGDELEERLSIDYLQAVTADEKKQEIYLYKDLYLSKDADVLNHEYAYASRMKLMGAVNAGKLDMVLMNREAYDLLSRDGYLLEFPPLLSQEAPELIAILEPFLTANEVILSDNEIEYQLGEAEAYEADSRFVTNGIQVADLPFFAQAGFSEPVYLGIIVSSERLPDCIRYIRYLLPEQS